MKQLFALLLLTAVVFASERSNLQGPWRVRTGGSESGSWFDPKLDDSNWELVPARSGGPVWYRISFAAPALTGESARLIPDPAFDGARAWLNGRELWGQDRGSDPFETDIASLLRQDQPNVLAVSLAHSKPSIHPGAQLLIGPRVFISNQKLVATPGGDVTATVWITNATENTAIAEIESKTEPAGGGAATGLTVSPGTTLSAELRWTVPPKAVHLWNPDHPNLYKLSTSLTAVSDSGDTHYRDSEETTFGIRKIEARGPQILMNGRSVSTLAHPTADEILPGFLNSADETGRVLIEESDGDRSALGKMVRRDWNHPSIAGWGIRDPADADFVRALDPSRVIRIVAPHSR